MADADYRPEPERPDRLLTRRDLRQRIPVSDMTIWRWEEAGLFPRHLAIGGRNFWRESEVLAWIERHAAERDQGAHNEEGLSAHRAVRPDP